MAGKKGFGGKPTKYKPEYCELLRQKGREGKLFIDFVAEVGVDKSTCDDWCKKYPDFDLARKSHKALSERFWAGELSKRAHNSDKLLEFLMKTKFGWNTKDEIEISGKIDVALTAAEIIRKTSQELHGTNPIQP